MHQEIEPLDREDAGDQVLALLAGRHDAVEPGFDRKRPTILTPSGEFYE